MLTEFVVGDLQVRQEAPQVGAVAGTRRGFQTGQADVQAALAGQQIQAQQIAEGSVRGQPHLDGEAEMLLRLGLEGLWVSLAG